jgi:hypothetical protein
MSIEDEIARSLVLSKQNSEVSKRIEDDRDMSRSKVIQLMNSAGEGGSDQEEVFYLKLAEKKGILEG